MSTQTTNGKKPVSLLLRKALQGDRQSFCLAFELYRGRIRGALQAYMEWKRRIPETADDVLQNLYLEAERRFPEYEPVRHGSFFVWLLRLGYQDANRLYRHHRAKKRDVGRNQRLGSRAADASTMTQFASIAADTGLSPSRIVIAEETAQRIRLAVKALPAAFRDVLHLVYFSGLSGAEAAQVLRITAPALRKRRQRALIELKRALKG